MYIYTTSMHLNHYYISYAFIQINVKWHCQGMSVPAHQFSWSALLQNLMPCAGGHYGDLMTGHMVQILNAD